MTPTRQRRLPPTALALAALLLLAAGAAPGGPEGKPIPNTVSDPNVSGSLAAVTPPEGPLVEPGPAPDLILVYTGRVVGYVEPCG